MGVLDVTIEIMRGLAACWVFIFHLDIPPAHPTLRALAEIGHLGVPMFFVISGFCIGGSAWGSYRRGEPALDFLRRRLWRIYPPFWVSILVVVALPFVLEGLSSLRTGSYFTPTPRWLSYSASQWAGVASLGIAFFSEGRELESAFSALNSVYWTLAIEVQFYATVFAILLAGRWAGWVLAAVTAAGCLSSLFPAMYRTGLFLPYWPLFAVGLGLYALARSGRIPARLWGARQVPVAAVGWLLLGAGFAILIWSSALGRAHAAAPFAMAFSFGLVFALFLWLGLSLEPLLDAWRRDGPILLRGGLRLGQMIGAASYSLYLLHGKLWALPAMFVRQVVPADSLPGLVAIVVSTIVLSGVFSAVVEQRFILARHGRAMAPLVPQDRPG